MMYYHDYQARYLEADYLQDQFSVTGFMQVNVALPQDWKLEVTGWVARQRPGRHHPLRDLLRS